MMNVIAEARDFLADCGFADDPDIPALTDEQIVAGVQRHYDGGWAAFCYDMSLEVVVTR